MLEAKRLLAADVVINELMYHQAGDNVKQEFIELFNRGSEAVAMSGWEFSAGVGFSFPDVAIPAGGFLVVAADAAAFAQRYPGVTNVVGGWTGRLANRGEGVTLVNAAAEQVDRVRYADEGDWAVRVLGPDDHGHRGWRWEAAHDGDGKSLELVNSALPNEYGQNWMASVVDGGTPGRENSVVSDDVAPLVIDLAHSPTIPRSSEPVTVSARVVDELPSDVAIDLSYRQDGTATFETIPMTRQGINYEAAIPAFPDQAIVEFYVTATDAGGNQRVVPTVESDVAARTANRLYQVLDAAPSPTSWVPTSQPFTYLITTEAERSTLVDIGDGPFFEAQSNAQMNGTFLRVDGNGVDVRYNVGIRNRGGASRVGPPNNYRVNFTHDATFNGTTSLNLNSRFTHAQIVGSAVYRLAGMPAADARPMQVRVNGVNLAREDGPVMFGSYAELEVITGSFPDRYFPTDRRGNLYRVVESGTETGDLRFEGTDPLVYQDTYSKRTNEETDDWSDLIDLVNVLNNATDEQFVSEINRVLDVDQWLRFIALDSLLGNLETGLNVGRGDNFWLYRGNEDARFKLIPHDLDTILGIGRVGQPNRSIFAYTATAGLERFLTHDEFVPRYYQAFVDLIEDVFNPQQLFPLMEQLIGFVSDDELADMKQFVVDRIEGVEAQLPTEFAVTSGLPIVNGFHRTALPSAEIVGTANALRTKSVMVNDIVADWSPFTRQWSVSVSGEGTVESLVPNGGLWNYVDDGSDLGNVWRTRSFDDSRWKSGPSPLGYGEGDEATKVSFGANPNDKHITSYFRHAFQIADASQILDLSLRLERDDGIIVYLNNQEIVRSNMPDGDVDFQTVASAWIGGGLEGQQLSFNIDPALLVDGENVLAVEVHQVTAIDDDLRFDLSLEATVGALVGGVPLHPGINRIDVTAYDGPGGTGTVVDSQFIDIWYDGSEPQDHAVCDALTDHGTPAPAVIKAGSLTENTVLGPCGPAYRVTGEVTIPEGVVLTVLPGTTMFFEANAGLRFQGGQLLAEGTEKDSIRFTRAPEVVGSWNGIQFVNSVADNRISHAVLEHATTEDGLVGLIRSQLQVDNTTFDHADFFRIVTIDSSLTVRNSTFVDMFQPGEAPATDNGSEHIKGSGILAGGQLVLQDNYFGTTTGHNDSVDFDGAQLPASIPMILNNVFAGFGDDALDLESDAYIEGNTFFDVVKDPFNNSTGDANAISAGAGRTYYVYRNVFHNVDHAVQVKDEAFLHFEHNTVDTVHISPIYFDLPDRSPGDGAAVDSSIFANTPVTFGAADQAKSLRVTNSIVAADGLAFGEGNFIAQPRLADPAAGDFSLLPGSPASRRGFAGMDLGGHVPAGPWISGVPAALTGQTSASIMIGGPGIDAYRYRLNGGPWSDAASVADPIQLEGLTAGTYELEVFGRNVAGLWQDESMATLSKPWTVDVSTRRVLLNEVLASNDSVEVEGGTPDLIELFNDSEFEIDLSGMTLSDDANDPTKYAFPSGSIIGPTEYLTLQATDAPGPGLRLGFRLNADGEGVYLFDSAENGGALLDSVEFGIQITDLSISRVGHDREWNLSEPTPGAPNQAISLGHPETVRINEWLSASDVRYTGDFLELYNADVVPVSLAGLHLTDDPIGQPARHEIADLSFIAANGYVTFDPNGNPDNGANELEFGLSANGEIITLSDETQRTIDQVFVLEQTIDVSQGRVPDGAEQLAYLKLGTPGNPNPVSITESVLLVDFDATWAFDQTGDDLGDAWRATEFDDSAWPTGPAAFGVASSEPPVPLATPLETGVVTHYFRHEFEVDPTALTEGSVFELSTLVDDGLIVYVNNVEVLRLGLPAGEVSSDTTANRGIGLAAIEGPFPIPPERLVPGTNVIAAEVHQVSQGSSDVVFAASLTASTTSTDETSSRAIAIQDGLRISELMYHPAGLKDAEYIELTNISEQVLNLTGVTISGGIDVTLSDVVLQPGEFAVLTPDPEVFRATYGSLATIAGVYDGSLSNGGEEIIVGLPAPFDGPFDGAVLRFVYSDSWHPTTDGDGFSLELVDVDGSIANWTRADGWRPSQIAGGTPGWSSTAQLVGDFNQDGVIDTLDADLLSSAIHSQTVDLIFDLNGDDEVDPLDQTFLIEGILETRPGDTNLDGDVDFDDFVRLAARFGKTSAVWSDADFNSDGLVDFDDFVALASNFGFERREDFAAFP